MDRKFLVIIAVLVLGFIGLVFFQRNNQPTVEAIRSNNVYGNLNSKVTLTEFLDFQCEACYAFYPTIEKVKETYKDRVKFQTKYFPLGGGHQYSRLTASYAEAAARQGKFFEMQAKLFQNQKIWEVGNTQEYMDKYAQEIGLDMNKVRADVKSASVNDTINADLQEARDIDATGTPTFLLNNKKIANPGNTYEAFVKLLDDALAKAGE
jgi:protein-disulfide isomerase